MFTSLFISLILPIQIHPISYNAWVQSPAPILQATIDAARIIGLPRLKTMDSSMYRTICVNEIQPGPVYQVRPRRVFIREYVQ